MHITKFSIGIQFCTRLLPFLYVGIVMVLINNKNKKWYKNKIKGTTKVLNPFKIDANCL